MNVTGLYENKYLSRINHSENRILELLSSPVGESNRSLDHFMKNSQDFLVYKQYVKRKINKLFNKIQLKVSSPSVPSLKTVHSENHLKIKPNPDFSSDQSVIKESPKPALSHKTASVKSLPPLARAPNSRKNLTPLNKSKYMKDYYYHIVKPLHNSKIKRLAKFV